MDRGIGIAGAAVESIEKFINRFKGLKKQGHARAEWSAAAR
jgi:hypothetical protein